MNKLAGFAMLLLGTITVSFMMIPRFFIILIDGSSSFWMNKYSMLILFIVGAVFFFLKGILFLSGKLVPDLVADKNNKILNSLFDSSFMLVACIPLSTTVIELSSKMHWKIVWIIADAILIFWFVSSYSEYKSNVKSRMMR